MYVFNRRRVAALLLAAVCLTGQTGAVRAEETQVKTVSETENNMRPKEAQEENGEKERARKLTEDNSENEQSAALQEKSAAELVKLLPAGSLLPMERISDEESRACFTAAVIEPQGAVYERIYEKSYKENGNTQLSELRYLKLPHYNYEGRLQVGEMIVHEEIADTVLQIFYELYQEQYQICSMYLVDDFWTGDNESTDTASLEANNTACFNDRSIVGSGSVSRHALGKAIDLNPLENPYVKERDGVRTILPEEGEAYLDRESGAEHLITHQDAAYRIFSAYGFEWGGDWSSLKDYQHFEFNQS
ncbi:MAG: M15 family metallopeptidase [Lachnospiraceae bacterium]|nr:M15 family metallopeptidase [Lachnospiraceae bacterium]